MNRRELKIDWTTLVLYLVFVFFGWMNIYAASIKNPDVSIFNIEYSYGKQFIWIVLALVLGAAILFMDNKLIEVLSYFVYGASVVALLLVLLLAREVNGARAWLDIGPFKLQPAEFAKVGTAMALAQFMSRYNFSFKKLSDQATIGGLIVVPAALILLQPDAGSALVFAAFTLMLFREGMSPAIMLFGTLAAVLSVLALVADKVWLIGSIWLMGALVWWFMLKRKYFLVSTLFTAGFTGLVLSVDFAFQHLLKPHQQTRIMALFNPYSDPLGTGWNITQSKIAIGSGGVVGKGFLRGTQTKFDFVPQQDTDFIFCTIGEEWGWLGSAVLLALFFVFLYRLLHMAENSRTKFARVYGYSVAAIFFFHIAINIGMAIGIAPVIGIPLPFFSYGGSSMLSFTVLLAILMSLYANRTNVLGKSRY
jgi:rod shape determining protein RodA